MTSRDFCSYCCKLVGDDKMLYKKQYYHSTCLGSYYADEKFKDRNKMISCKLCGYTFSSDADQGRHYKSVHPVQKESKVPVFEIDKTLQERGNNYGDFKDTGRIAQNLKSEMRQNPGWINLSHPQREALEMIQHKIARILNGNPQYKDSWTDIIGYARLIEKDLK